MAWLSYAHVDCNTHTQTLILNKRYRSLLTSAIILQLFVLDGAICKKSWKTSSSVTRRSKFPTYLSIKVQIIYDKYGIKKQPQSQTKLTTEIASHAYRIAIPVYACTHTGYRDSSKRNGIKCQFYSQCSWLGVFFAHLKDNERQENTC